MLVDRWFVDVFEYSRSAPIARVRRCLGVEISKQMGRRQINLLHLLDCVVMVTCHKFNGHRRPCRRGTWGGGVHIATPSNLPSKMRFYAGFRVLWGFFISSLSFLWLCVILFQLRLCAVTEAVKAASNGECVPGRQLVCFQLVNSSTEFYEIRHWRCTLNFHE